jgi:hypothetical protein
MTFTPTGEWQEVPDDAVLPPGCHIRLNLQTGKKESRRPKQRDEVPEPADGLDDHYEAQGKPNGATSPPLPAGLSAKAFVEGYVAPEYTIDGLLQRARVYSLTGQTGHGKTAVGLALAVSKATGRPLEGRRVDPGPVVYLAAENPDDVRARMILMAERLALDLDQLPITFFPGTFSLCDGLAPLSDFVKAAGGASLVVVDTGAAFLAASGAGDENDNMGALRFALDLRRLTELPGQPTALALMHPTKRATRDDLLPRGGGAFLNEMDGNLTVWAEGERETTELSWAGKLRGPSFDPIVFMLETGTCAKLADAAGRQIPSVWAFPVDARRAEQSVTRQKGEEDDVLLVMARAPAGSLATWASALGWTFPNGQPAKYRVERAIKRLAADKLATKKRDRWVLTKAGKDEAEALERHAE